MVRDGNPPVRRLDKRINEQDNTSEVARYCTYPVQGNQYYQALQAPEVLACEEAAF